MKSLVSRTVPIYETSVWQADKRLLPSYLCASDNGRRIRHYKRALKNAINTRLSPIQREQLLLFYNERLTKTQIGRRYGVGSSTVCKTLKSAERILREYAELFMEVYDIFEREGFDADDEYGELTGG